MNNKNILIVGAGIAGLTLAYWLKKYGFTPSIVEKHTSLRTEGYKLDIRGAALDVVQRMGIFPALCAARTEIQKAQFVDDSGKILMEISPDLCGVRHAGDIEIVRGDLCRILFQEVKSVPCIFGDSIKSCTESANGVYVEFEKHEPELFDLVIGADGLHSKVRNLSFGEESQFLRELGFYVSFYSIPNFLGADPIEIEYYSPKRFAQAYCPRGGIAKAGFAFSWPTTSPLDQSQQQALLREAFQGAGWEIPRLLEYMKETPDFYFDCMAQIHMPHWTKGRIALVGDAGYAVSPAAGQGTSVALVGAYVLASELKEAQGNYVQAFQRYEENLRGFIDKNQKLVRLGTTIMEGEAKSKILWFLYRLLPGRLLQLCKKWSLRKTTKAACAIQLKSY